MCLCVYIYIPAYSPFYVFNIFLILCNSFSWSQSLPLNAKMISVRYLVLLLHVYCGVNFIAETSSYGQIKAFVVSICFNEYLI